MKNGAAQEARTEVALPYPHAPARSTLAAGTIEGRTAALDDSPHRPAARAGPAGAVINRERLGEIAELAVGARKVAQRRATRGNRLHQHAANCGRQPLQPLERNRAAGAF